MTAAAVRPRWCDTEPEPPIGYVRHLFTAAEAERVLGIPAATVRSWARRQRIWSFGLDERNRPMYDRDHLLALLNAVDKITLDVFGAP